MIKLLTLLLLSIFTIQFSSFSQVLLYETKVTINNLGHKTRTVNYRIQVNTKDDLDDTEMTIHHQKQNKFTLLNAQIKDVDGKVLRKIKNKDIETRSSISRMAFFEDYVSENFDMFCSTYPHILEYSYQIVEKEFISVVYYWYPLARPEMSTLKSSLTIEIPVDYEISILNEDSIEQHEYAYTPKTRTLKYFYGETKLPESERHAPYFWSRFPFIYIVPDEFQYGTKGWSESWESFGYWEECLNEGTDDLPDYEKKIVDGLIAGLDSKRAIIDTLYKYMQQKTKYVYVAEGTGGLKSHPASYVAANKYGDCKALSTYMKSMLSHAGIESYYTTIYSGEVIKKVVEDFPSHQSNHVILTVPLESDTIWLENTSNNLPAGYVHTSIQNRKALMVNGKSSQLIDVPPLDEEDVLVSSNYYFKENEQPTVSIRKTLRGDDFESLLYYGENASKEDQEKYIKRKITIKGFELNNWSIDDSKLNDFEIDLNVEGNCEKRVQPFGSFKILSPYKMPISKFEKPKDRTLDVQINYPINMLDTVKYELPNIESLNIQLPENQRIITPYGKYIADFSVENNMIVLIEHFTLNRQYCPRKEYDGFYEFISKIVNFRTSNPVVIK